MTSRKSRKTYKAPILIAIGIGAFIFAVVVHSLLLDIDRQFSNIGAAIFGTLGSVFLSLGLLWNRTARQRWAVLAAGVAVLLLFGICFEYRGVTGELVPTFRWRFSRMPTGLQRTHDLTDAKSLQELGLTGVPLEAKTARFTQFLGNARSGRVTSDSIDLDWNQSPPRLLWRRPVGDGWSGMTVADGIVWTLHQRGEREAVSAFDLLSGEELWTASFSGRHSEAMGGVGPRSTPTWHAGSLYVQTATGLVARLDAKTGEIDWQIDVLLQGFSSQSESESAIKWGRAGSPLIVPDVEVSIDGSKKTLVVVPQGGVAGTPRLKTLIALDSESGEIVWSAGDNQISYASPALMNIDGMPQIVSVNEGFVTGHRPESGEVLWKEEWPNHSNSDACASQPVDLGNGRIMLGKGYTTGAKLISVQAGRVAAKEDTAIDWSVDEIWRNRKVLKTKLTNAVHVDGALVGLSDGVLEAVNEESGERIWRKGRYGQGQILVVNETILVTSERGMLVLVDPLTGAEIYSQQVLDGVCWNYPAVAGPFILVRNGTEMVCFYSGMSTLAEPAASAESDASPGDPADEDRDTESHEDRNQAEQEAAE